MEDAEDAKWVKGKKRRQEDSDEDSHDDLSSDSISDASDESFDENMEIPVEFEAFPPMEEDFSGIQCLLQQLFLKSTVDLSCLSDLIISQPEVATVIKVANEEDNGNGSEDPSMGDEEEKTETDVFGVTTVVNFTKYKENTAVKQLKKLLMDKCQECGNEDTQTRFIELVEKAQHTVGFLISERFINIPPQIAVPVYKTLRSDLKKNHKKEKKMALSYFIFVCKTYKDVETRNHKKKKKTKKQQSPTSQLNFINTEDELFLKESELSFTFPASTSADETLVAGQWTSEDSELRPYRTVLVLSADRFDRALESIYALYSQQ